MNGVLFKLYLLTLKGALRGVGRKFTTVRGALLSVLTLGFFGLMFAQLIAMVVLRSHVSFASSDRSSMLAGILPFGMLAYFLLGITPSLGERAIQFSASEIDFLFPAPFTRRQLLAFYLLRGIVGKLGLAIVFSVSISFLVPSLVCAILGIFWALVFLHGATVAAQLVQQVISTQLYSRARRVIVTVVIVAAGIGLASALPTEVDAWSRVSEFRASTAVRATTAPFDVLARIIVAPRLLPQALPDLAIALAMNGVLYWLIFSLDARYEDSAVRTSQRVYDRIQAVRAGNTYARSTSRTEYSSSLVPPFPWWGGVGPNLRRQVVSGLRSLQGLVWLGLILAVVSGSVLVFVLRENPKIIDYVGYVVLGGTAYVTFILSGQMPFGFRGDLNHMEVLKALPLRPIAIATAEVVGPSLVCCLGQWFLVVVGILGAPSQAAILLSGAAFYFPYNLLLLGGNNLFLLLFPFRLASSGPDVTLMGRVLLMMVGNLLAMILSFGIAAIPAAIVYLVTENWFATLVIAWFVLMALGSGLLLVVGWAFRRFDVSTEMPD